MMINCLKCIAGTFCIFIAMFWMSRGYNRILITHLLNRSNYKKRTKGQNLIDILLYRRFRDVLPTSFLIAYFGNFILAILTGIVSVILCIYITDTAILTLPMAIYMTIAGIVLAIRHFNWDGPGREWGPEYEFERKGRNKK